MSSVTQSETFKDLGERFVVCSLVFWIPFLNLWQFRGQPTSVAALIQPVGYVFLAAISIALIMGAKKGLWRSVVLGLMICLYLDLDTSWFNGGVVLGSAILIVALCWLLRKNMVNIVAMSLGVVFVSSLFLSPTPQAAYSYEQGKADQSASDAPELQMQSSRAEGLLVHLMLDEFVGFAGFPAEIPEVRAVQAELSALFAKYGLTSHDYAFSQFTSTRDSLSNALNFSLNGAPNEYYRGKNPYVLESNAYFENLHRRGYSINVVQSTYMDYCSESLVPIASCYTYRHDSTDWLSDSGFDDNQKMSVLIGMYLNHPGAMESFFTVYAWLREKLKGVGVNLPAFLQWDGKVTPVATVAALEQLTSRIGTAERGDAFFAHLLIPHAPYVYSSDCQLRQEPFDWLSNYPHRLRTNTAEGREMRYQQYFEQVRCTLRKLEPLMTRLKQSPLWEHTKIIIHGDHGSRIALTVPRARNKQRITATDLSDSFNILFAYRVPGRSLSFNSQPQSLVHLLQAVSAQSPENEADGETRSVYLEGDNNEGWVEQPWPE
jgi:hypothetical protein